MGCTNQAGEDNRNVARMGLLLAGLPVEVPGVTVNRLCASGLEAVNQARAADQAAATADLVLAGGVESMTRAPLAMPKPDRSFPRGNPTVYDTTIGWRFVNPRMEELHAHRLDGRDGRERRRALRHRRAPTRTSSRSRATAARVAAAGGGPLRRGDRPGAGAAAEGRAGHGPLRRGPARRTPRSRSSASLRPVFREGGTVTAGNSSQINDGAACVVLASAGARARARPRAAGAHRVDRRGRRRAAPTWASARSRRPARRSSRAGLERRATSTSSS